MSSSPLVPSAPAPPPHANNGGNGRFQRTRVVEAVPPTHTPPPAPGAMLMESVAPLAPQSPPKSGAAPRHHAQSQVRLSGAPTGTLTEDAVQRAFGSDDTPNNNISGAAGGAQSGAGVSVASHRPGGGMVVPTRKDGNDAVSMYSVSQSILPADPRERIYYRPRRHLLQCYVQRRKQGGVKSLFQSKHKSFEFFLEHTNDFVLASVPPNLKKSANIEDTSDGVGGRFYGISKGGGNIVFTVNQQQLDQDTRSFVGKLSRRGSGMEMVMFSEGNKADRKEILAVLLDHFEDTSRSSFTVILPAVDEASGYIKPLEGGEVRFLRDGRGGTTGAEEGSRAGIDAAMSDSSEDDVAGTTSIAGRVTPSFAATATIGTDTSSPKSGRLQMKFRSHSLLASEYKRDATSANIIVLRNKAPQWDAVLRGYKLDFHGRATKASEKNFQLVPDADPAKVVMLFGKQSEDRFALDFRYPLCGLQAAAIATTIMTARKILK